VKKFFVGFGKFFNDWANTHEPIYWAVLMLGMTFIVVVGDIPEWLGWCGVVAIFIYMELLDRSSRRKQ
jgi:hypothetical protein